MEGGRGGTTEIAITIAGTEGRGNNVDGKGGIGAVGRDGGVRRKRRKGTRWGSHLSKQNSVGTIIY